jgi:hypothetical protein
VLHEVQRSLFGGSGEGSAAVSPIVVDGSTVPAASVTSSPRQPLPASSTGSRSLRASTQGHVGGTARSSWSPFMIAVIRRREHESTQEAAYRNTLRRLTVASLLLIASELLAVLLVPVLALTGVLWMGAPGYITFCATGALGSIGACLALAVCVRVCVLALPATASIGDVGEHYCSFSLFLCCLQHQLNEWL